MGYDPSGTWEIPNWVRIIIGVGAIAASFILSGTVAPVLTGILVGAMISGGFELCRQLLDGGTLDGVAIAWAAFGGAVSGAISAISGVNDFTFVHYLGSACIGGAACSVGGIVSGSVTDMSSVGISFGIGAFANVVAKGVANLKVNYSVNKIMEISSSKGRSIAINDYMIKNNIVPMDMGHNAFGGWSVNIFKGMSRDFFRDVVIDMTSRNSFIYMGIISSMISGWY
jgi:hypothetical protein